MSEMKNKIELYESIYWKAFGHRLKDCKAYVEEKKYYAGFGHVNDFEIVKVIVREI